MKRITKYIALLMSLIMMLSSLSFGVSAEAFSQPEITENEATAVNNSDYKSDTVALLYLCSNWTGFPSLGHIWIYIENVSNKAMKVGVYDLPAGEGVSVGTFGLTRSDGFGVYYNIEAYTGNLFGMGESMYLMTELNQKEFDNVSNKIATSNFWDPAIFNCAFFAITTWMTGGGSIMMPIVVFPTFARIQMKLQNYKSGLKMFYPSRENVYKQIGNGSSAKLRKVVDGSVDTPPG